MKRRFVAFALAFVFLLPACYCLQEAHKMEPKCRALNAFIDCNKEAIKSFFPHLAPLLAWLLTFGQANVDGAAMLTALESAGLDVVACTAQALDEILTEQEAALPADTGPTASPLALKIRSKAAAVHRGAGDYLKAKFPGGVKFSGTKDLRLSPEKLAEVLQ